MLPVFHPRLQAVTPNRLEINRLKIFKGGCLTCQTLPSDFWRMGGPPTNPSQQPTSPQRLSPVYRVQVVKIREHWRSDNRHEKSSTWPLEPPCAASPRKLAARRGCPASPDGGSWWWKRRWESWTRSSGGASSHYDAHGELWPNRPFSQESSPGKDVNCTVRWSSWQDGLHRGLSSSLKESTVLLDIVHFASEAFCNKALHKACLNWRVILNVLRGRGR